MALCPPEGVAPFCPTRRIIAAGCFQKIPEILRIINPRTILIVLGEGSFQKTPYLAQLKKMLGAFEIIYSKSVPQNPTQAFLQQEIDQRKGKAVDAVLAIGGGSVLDTAKILVTLPHEKITGLQFHIETPGKIQREATPLVVLPTTSGTGSEVTPYASIETRDHKKVTIESPVMFPRYALVDPELTYTMPPYLTACTGFDALSQAIESFWSVRATQETRVFSLKALRLILQSLPVAFRESQNPKARFNMACGSSEAGVAIAQTKTTAVHAVSYPITTHFHVAHGHACALTLAAFVRFNATTLGKEGKPLLERFNVPDYESMARAIEQLMDTVSLERSLTSLGIDAAGRERIVREGFRTDRVKNNPCLFTSEQLKTILESLK